MKKEEAIKRLKELRSGNWWAFEDPNEIDITNGALDMAIEALQNLSKLNNGSQGSDLISRQDAIDAFGLSEKTRKYGGDHSGYDTIMLYEIQDVLESLPSAGPKTGEWIEHEWAEEYDGLLISNYECTNCHSWERNNTDFCPNCGSKMGGKENGHQGFE